MCADFQTDQLLASYRACDSLESATGKDILSYKTWLSKNSPIVETETRFLDRADLVRVSDGRRRNLFWYVSTLTAPTTITAKLVHLTIGFCAMALLVIPSLAGRMFLLVLLAAVAGHFYIYEFTFHHD